MKTKKLSQKEILGPSWSPEKNNNSKINFINRRSKLKTYKRLISDAHDFAEENYEKEKEQSVKAIASNKSF